MSVGRICRALVRVDLEIRVGIKMAASEPAERFSGRVQLCKSGTAEFLLSLVLPVVVYVASFELCDLCYNDVPFGH